MYYNYPLYDSYGYIRPLDIQNEITPYIFNDKDIQDYNSTSCGYYCTAFIKFLSDNNEKNNAFETFINIFSKNTKKMIKYYIICLQLSAKPFDLSRISIFFIASRLHYTTRWMA